MGHVPLSANEGFMKCKEKTRRYCVDFTPNMILLKNLCQYIEKGTRTVAGFTPNSLKMKGFKSPLKVHWKKIIHYFKFIPLHIVLFINLFSKWVTYSTWIHHTNSVKFWKLNFLTIIIKINPFHTGPFIILFPMGKIAFWSYFHDFPLIKNFVFLLHNLLSNNLVFFS